MKHFFLKHFVFKSSIFTIFFKVEHNSSKDFRDLSKPNGRTKDKTFLISLFRDFTFQDALIQTYYSLGHFIKKFPFSSYILSTFTCGTQMKLIIYQCPKFFFYIFFMASLSPSSSASYLSKYSVQVNPSNMILYLLCDHQKFVVKI